MKRIFAIAALIIILPQKSSFSQERDDSLLDGLINCSNGLMAEIFQEACNEQTRPRPELTPEQVCPSVNAVMSGQATYEQREACLEWARERYQRNNREVFPFD